MAHSFSTTVRPGVEGAMLASPTSTGDDAEPT